MVNRKHVLFVVENQSVPYDVRVWNEARAVKEMGYDVSAVCPVNERATKKYERIQGIDIYRHPAPVEANGKAAFLFEYLNALIWELILCFRVFRKKPFHIIHAANPPDHVFLIAKFFKPLGVKFVFDHHDLCPENYVAKFGRKDLFYRILLLMEKLTFQTANIVISTNESYKKIAINRGKKRESEVFVVRNGPDLTKIPQVKPNPELKKGFDYLVAYLGVIGTQEGIDVLLKAIDYIVHERGISNIKFVIVGTGPNWANMVALSNKLGLDGNVEFTGFIPYQKLYEILATADLCVNPEFRNEFTDKSTMIKIMDYMTFGKPIVQFYTTEGEETAGSSAVYVKNNDVMDFGDAIIELLSDPERRKRLGEIGRARIEKRLHWGVQKRNLQEAYQRLVSKM